MHRVVSLLVLGSVCLAGCDPFALPPAPAVVLAVAGTPAPVAAGTCGVVHFTITDIGGFGGEVLVILSGDPSIVSTQTGFDGATGDMPFCVAANAAAGAKQVFLDGTAPDGSIQHSESAAFDITVK